MTAPADGFVVERRLRVAGADAAGLARAAQGLAGLPGVRRVAVEAPRRRLRVCYDASQVGYGEIEAALEDIGLRPDGGFAQRWRSAWYRYLDENARGNARQRPAGCCSRPAGIYGPRPGPRGGGRP